MLMNQVINVIYRPSESVLFTFILFLTKKSNTVSQFESKLPMFPRKGDAS